MARTSTWTSRSGFCGLCRSKVYTEKGSFNRHRMTNHPHDDEVPFVSVDKEDCQAVQDAMDAGNPLPARYDAPLLRVDPTPAPAPAPTRAPVPALAAAAAAAAAPATALPPPPPSPPAAPEIRASRSTRNQDHGATARNRGILDLDPTEGLPVQKWEQISVTVNQDPSVDPSAASKTSAGGTLSTTSPEWAAQFETEKYPWAEKPLPHFISQIPPHNQELLRRARCGNTNPSISVYDPKTNSYITGVDAEKRARANQLKSVHLNNLDPSLTATCDDTNGNNSNTANTADGTASGPGEDTMNQDQDQDQDQNSSDDNEDNDNENDDGSDEDDSGLPARRTTLTNKRRKYATPFERTFEIKRWQQVPQPISEAREDRKFLSDRRPGMPSLYGTPLQNEIFGQMGLTQQGYGYTNYGGNVGTSYDLGDGAGLGSALGGNPGAAVAEPAPVRKNMPPKRKKKKGGPGRRKATTIDGANMSSASISNTGTDGTGASLGTEGHDVQMLDAEHAEGEGDADGAESDEEGSEEGEINDDKAGEPSIGDDQPTIQIGPGATVTSEPMANLDTTMVLEAQPILAEEASKLMEQVHIVPSEAPTSVAEPILSSATEISPVQPEIPTAMPKSVPTQEATMFTTEHVIDPSPNSVPIEAPSPIVATEPVTEMNMAGAASPSIVGSVSEIVAQPVQPIEAPLEPLQEHDLKVAGIEQPVVAEQSEVEKDAPLSDLSSVKAVGVSETEPVPETALASPRVPVPDATPASVLPSTAQASSEVDLLGGLEDQLDRDMAS